MQWEGLKQGKEAEGKKGRRMKENTSENREEGDAEIGGEGKAGRKEERGKENKRGEVTDIETVDNETKRRKERTEDRKEQDIRVARKGGRRE